MRLMEESGMAQGADKRRAARGSRRFISQFAELEFSPKRRHRGGRLVILLLLLAALALALYDALHG